MQPAPAAEGVGVDLEVATSSTALTTLRKERLGRPRRKVGVRRRRAVITSTRRGLSTKGKGVGRGTFGYTFSDQPA